MKRHIWYLSIRRRSRKCLLGLFWSPLRTSLILYKKIDPQLAWSVVRCFFLCFSGQRGTIALKLGFTCKEHLCVVALTGSARWAQTHPLASYFLVRSSIALHLLVLSGEYRCLVLSGLCLRCLIRSWSSLPLFQSLTPYPAYLPLLLDVLYLTPPAVTKFKCNASCKMPTRTECIAR